MTQTGNFFYHSRVIHSKRHIDTNAEKRRTAEIPLTIPVAACNPHHSQENNKEDKEAARDTIDNGRGDGVRERVICHTSQA